MIQELIIPHSKHKYNMEKLKEFGITFILDIKEMIELFNVI
jgi:hypothetical protein